MQQTDIDRISRGNALAHAVSLAQKQIENGESEDVCTSGIVARAETFRKFLAGE